jgi:hypothetical protein
MTSKSTRVGVFPQCEEVLIRTSGFGRVALQYELAAEAQMRERSKGFVYYNSALSENSGNREDLAPRARKWMKRVAGALRFNYKN